MFNNYQRDGIAIVGIALAIIQTLIAVYALSGPIRLRTQAEVDLALVTRSRLAKLFLFAFCSELLIVIIVLPLYLEGMDWKVLAALLFFAQMLIIITSGIRIFNASKNSIAVAIVYAVMLTITVTVSLQYRVRGDDDLEALNIHDLRELFRLQIVPLVVCSMIPSSWCFLRYCIGLTRELFDVPFRMDGTISKAQDPTQEKD